MLSDYKIHCNEGTQSIYKIILLSLKKSSITNQPNQPVNQNHVQIEYAENISKMSNSVNISIEAPIENQIQEITYDGQEIYQA